MKEAHLVRRFLHKDTNVFLPDCQYCPGRLQRVRDGHPDLLNQTLSDNHEGSIGVNRVCRGRIFSTVDSIGQSCESRLECRNI